MRAESLPFLERGVALFNQQKFWEAHEVWEDAWKTETGEPRRFLHGLIQVAAGFVKLQRGEPKGTVSLLDKGAEKLADIPSGRYGIDTAGLLTSVSLWRGNASRMVAAGATDYDAAALPRLELREPRSK